MTEEVSKYPTVTIVVSCYNHEDYIESCINSILRQTYPAIELLTYDDGSSDSSAEKLQQLADKHGFSFTRQSNKGLSSTLNAALARATGKYFCSLGSDDILMLDKTEKQVAFMEAHSDVAVCAGNALFIDTEGMLLNKRQRFYPARDLSFEELFENTTPGFISPTAMIRTDVLRSLGGYRSDIPLEDLYLWLKIASQKRRIHALNDIVLYYRKHANNTYKDTTFMLSSILKTLEEYKEHPAYSQVVAKNLNSLLARASKQGDKTSCRKILKQLPASQYNSKTLRSIIRMWFR